MKEKMDIDWSFTILLTGMILILVIIFYSMIIATPKTITGHQVEITSLSGEKIIGEVLLVDKEFIFLEVSGIRYLIPIYSTRVIKDLGK